MSAVTRNHKMSCKVIRSHKIGQSNGIIAQPLLSHTFRKARKILYMTKIHHFDTLALIPVLQAVEISEIA